MAKKKVDKQTEFKNFNMLAHFTVKDMSSGDGMQGEVEVIKLAGTANYQGELDEQGYGTYVDLTNETVQVQGIDVKTWKQNPVILWQHDREKPIGKGTKIEKRKDSLYLECEIHRGACDEEMFYAIKSGLVSTFSIGFRPTQCDYREVDGTYIRYIMKCLLLEVSCVTIPANSASNYSIVKALDNGEGFYVEGEEDKDDYHGEVDLTDQEESNNKGDTMKLKVKDLLDADKVKELEELGLKEALEQEQEIDIKTYIDGLVAKEIAKLKEEFSKKEVETTEKTEEEKEAEALAAKEAEELAAKEAQDALDTEIKALQDMIAEVKTLTDEEV